MAVAPNLGVAGQFGVLANSGVTGSAGAGTVVCGDVGSSPTPTITNFPPSTVTPPSTIHFTDDPIVQQARIDAIAAYNFLLAQGPATLIAPQLNGQVLTAGIYSPTSGGAFDLAAGGTLTLTGSPTDIFIFQVPSSLTANVGSNIVLVGVDPCNIFWAVGTSATLNGTSFSGLVFADASITVGSGSDVSGQLFAGLGATGAVTMAGAGGNTICGCALACPLITLTPTELPATQQGNFYNQNITASGGQPPYTFAVTSGSLPTGLVLSPFGIISGIVSAAPGNYNFTITATDVNGCMGSEDYTIVVSQFPGGGNVTKSFSPSSVSAGTPSTLTIEIFNTGSTTISGITFNDAFPAGLVVAPIPNETTNMGGSFVPPPSSGDTFINFVGGSIPAGQTGIITIQVVSNIPDTYVNDITVISDLGTLGSGSGTLIVTALPPIPPKKKKRRKGFGFQSSICVQRYCYDQYNRIVPCDGRNTNYVPCDRPNLPTPNGMIYEKYAEDERKCCFNLKPINPNNR